MPAEKWCRFIYHSHREDLRKRAEGSRALPKQTNWIRESREVTVMIRQKQLAVFSEERQAWIAEAGIYGIWVGNSIDSAVLSAYLTVPQEVVLEKTHRICPRKDYFEELCKDSFENGAGRAEEGKEEIPVYEFEPCIEPER